MVVFKQGAFVPKFPEKCINQKTPTYRSSYEERFMKFLDSCANVLKWGSETHIVQYFLETDGKQHRYIIDFYMEVVDATSGAVVKYLIEIKPEVQTKMPKPPARMTAKKGLAYNNALKVAVMNKSKWEAAERFAKSKGMIFKVITEKELGIYR